MPAVADATDAEVVKVGSGAAAEEGHGTSPAALLLLPSSPVPNGSNGLESGSGSTTTTVQPYLAYVRDSSWRGGRLMEARAFTGTLKTPRLPSCLVGAARAAVSKTAAVPNAAETECMVATGRVMWWCW